MNYLDKINAKIAYSLLRMTQVNNGEITIGKLVGGVHPVKVKIHIENETFIIYKIEQEKQYHMFLAYEKGTEFNPCIICLSVLDLFCNMSYTCVEFNSTKTAIKRYLKACRNENVISVMDFWLPRISQQQRLMFVSPFLKHINTSKYGAYNIAVFVEVLNGSRTGKYIIRKFNKLNNVTSNTNRIYTAKQVQKYLNRSQALR